MNTKEIIKSFKPQDELNPKIWYLPKEKNMGDSDGQEMKMRPEVREKLLEIAYQFLDYLKIEVMVTDIVLTGSLSNYNWSKYSDFDIHIIINYNQTI